MAGLEEGPPSATGNSQLLSRDSLNTRCYSNAEVLCQSLRKVILAGEMQPGQRIVVDGLAERLGISKIPIREALGRLLRFLKVSDACQAAFPTRRRRREGTLS